MVSISEFFTLNTWPEMKTQVIKPQKTSDYTEPFTLWYYIWSFLTKVAAHYLTNMLSTGLFQKNWEKLPSRFSGYRHGLSEEHKLQKKIQKDSFERQTVVVTDLTLY